MPHTGIRRAGQCTNTWDDGWGHHECQRAAGHQFDATYPRCMCDCDDMVTHPDQPRVPGDLLGRDFSSTVDAAGHEWPTPKEQP